MTTSISETIKSADWKNEKHVPVIESPDNVRADEIFQVKVTIGKEVAHPNKTEHHIRWITLCFQPDGAPVPIQVANLQFDAHGESADGPDTGPVYTHHQAVASMKTAKPGTLSAVAYCNIHGLWQSQKEITLS